MYYKAKDYDYSTELQVAKEARDRLIQAERQMASYTATELRSYQSFALKRIRVGQKCVNEVYTSITRKCVEHCKADDIETENEK